MVKIFIENATALSIDLNTIDNYNKTGFYLACENGHLGVMKIFIENAEALRTDFEVTDELTNDFYACVRRHPNVFKLLKEWIRTHTSRGNEFASQVLYYLCLFG